MQYFGSGTSHKKNLTNRKLHQSQNQLSRGKTQITNHLFNGKETLSRNIKRKSLNSHQSQLSNTFLNTP